MPDLAQYSSTTLPLPLKYQLLSAVRIEWSWAFTGSGCTWDYTRKATHLQYFTLSEQDVLISFVEVNQRSLQYADETFQAYGLSAAYTYPAYRNEGFGSRLCKLRPTSSM